MEKRAMIIVGVVFSLLLIGGYFQLTGKITGENNIGIPEEEQECMKACLSVGCADGDIECMMKNKDKCAPQCGANPEHAGEDERCVDDCISKNCEEGPTYVQCMNEYIVGCDKECGMIKEPEAQSEEEQCIKDCVAKIDPKIICRNSKEGETGNEVCRRCADECVYLYAGPCLNDEEIKSKQKECKTCEHCYGEPTMGDSGEGWECIVDVKCGDASSEFGDEPGKGPGIGQEGYVAPNIVMKAVDGIVGFFRDLFGNEEPQPQEENTENINVEGSNPEQA
jgi:hypothetical protein